MTVKYNSFYEMLQILRHLFGGEAIVEEYDRSGVAAEAQRQALSGLVAEYVANHDTRMSHTEKMLYVSQIVNIERKNRRMNGQVAWLAGLLDNNGIRYAVMKGQTVARFYPNPLLRMPGDIDVYVAEKDFSRACRLLEEQGYTKTDFTMLHATYSKKGCAEVEVHFAVQKLQWLPHYRFLQSVTRGRVDSSAARYTVIDGQDVAILPAELELLLYTVHAFNHVLNGGLGLRHVTDWMLCVNDIGRDSIDIDIFKTYLSKTGMLRMFRVLGYICSRHLGMPLDTWFWRESGLSYNARDRRIGEKLLSWIEVAGNFGHSMNLSKVQYYTLFLKNCLRFGQLNRKEMYVYPFMKIKRWILGENHIR